MPLLHQQKKGDQTSLPSDLLLVICAAVCYTDKKFFAPDAFASLLSPKPAARQISTNNKVDDMENNTFKGTLFGGFNREDVIDYITKTSADSTARIEALEADIDRLCTQEQDLRTQLTASQAECAALQEELRLAQAARDAAQQTLGSLNDELTALRAEVETLRRENAALRTEAETLRPLSEQYCTIKDHLAGIELDAHQRAEEYERSTRERMTALIASCRSLCDGVLSTLSTTCESVSGELERAERSLSVLPSAFETLRSSLDELETRQ